MLTFISGFMGSGKSHFLFSWEGDFEGPSYDFDKEICLRLGISDENLGAWIDKEGWPAFRAQERQLLIETLEKGVGLYSLGGGTLHSCADLCSRMDKIANRVWINTSWETCWGRVKGDSNRPLVKKGEQAFQQLYLEREALYTTAKVAISGETSPPNWEEFCNKYRDNLILD